MFVRSVALKGARYEEAAIGKESDHGQAKVGGS